MGPIARIRGFTLVEILVIVIILGILAAVVVPKFVNATEDAAVGSTYYELQKIRRAIDVYMARNDGSIPAIVAGNGTWGPLVGTGDYLKSAPVNNWIGGANATVIIVANTPDGAYQTTHGWIFDDTTGQVWAGGFDGSDVVLPKP